MERLFHKNTKIVCAVISILLILCLLARGTVYYMEQSSRNISQQGDEGPTVITNEDLSLETLEEIATTISEQNEELLAKPGGGKNEFTILEVVPDMSYQTFGYLIKGMEPLGEEGMTTLVNGEWNNNPLLRLVGTKESDQTPITMIENGLKRETLDKAADYKDQVGTKQENKWQRETFTEDLEGMENVQVPGYFEKVASGNGIYGITVDKSEYVAAGEGEGAYEANIDIFYAKGDSTPKGEYTGYDFTPIFVEKEEEESEGYVVSKVTKDNDGDYVLDIENPNMQAFVELFAEMEPEEIDAYVKEHMTEMIFCPYEELPPAEGEQDEDTQLQRYSLTFKYQSTVGTSIPVFYEYDSDKLFFEPGRGKYAAKLKANKDDEYYTKVGAGKGNYNCEIIDYKITLMPWEGRDWVFHPYPTTGVSVGTPTMDVYEKGIFEVEDFKGVLSGGVYKKGYYCKNSYRNNEWFKLLCLRVNGYTYNYDITPKENLDASHDYIRNYDKSNTIKIITVTPQEVTADMVENAELIYVNNVQPFENLSEAWKHIMGETYIDGSGNEVKYGGDFTGDFSSFQLISTMYKDTMLKERAVIMSVTLEAGYSHTNSNLFKLYLLFTGFQDPHNMEYFFPTMRGIRAGFNYIDESTGNIVLRMPAGGSNGHNKVLTGDTLTNYMSEMDAAASDAAKEAIEQKYFNYVAKDENGKYPENAYWQENYFKVSMGWDNIATGFEWGNQNNSWVGNLTDQERYLVTTWYTSGFFSGILNMEQIYRILHMDSYQLTVTNAVWTSETDAVIYVDEYDEHYYVYYMINGEAVFYELPVTEKVSIYVDTDKDGYVDPGSTPVYVRPAPIPLKENESVTFYPGAAWDAKADMGTEHEKHYVVVAEGYKKSPTGELQVPVKSQVAITLIVRDLFDLN